MGGFLYAARQPGDSLQAVEQTLRASLDVHQKRGLKLSDRIVQPDFVVFVFGKALAASPNVVRFETGDFIVGTGTLLYKASTGRGALRALYDDFSEQTDVFTDLIGQFSVLIRKQGALYLFNDFNGLYHVYSNRAGTLVSNSFLAVARSTVGRVVSQQELFEYLCGGAMLGDGTLLRDVVRLDSQAIHRLHPDRGRTAKRMSVQALDDIDSVEDQLLIVTDALLRTFRAIQKNFGDRMCTALSGGFDSRLMLALLRATGAHPALYVYGGADSADVRVALHICRGEGLRIQSYDKDTHEQVAPDALRGVVAERFYFLDGLGPGGAFDSGADLLTRRQRSLGGTLQLNGGGGEIYRDFWKLKGTPIDVDLFVRTRMAASPPGVFTDAFNPGHYVAALSQRVRSILNLSTPTMNSRQAQELYWRMRLRYWMGPNNSANNVLSFALTPFAEPALTIPSAAIPHAVRHNGSFEASLIRRLDPNLARYPSVYGFNFYDPITSGVAPGGRRGLLRVPRLPGLGRRRRARAAHARPFYLRDEYVGEVVGTGPRRVSDYVHLDRITDVDMLNRALTVELLLADTF
jgi:asparagine synthase (glutamine-hydrolysing)